MDPEIAELLERVSSLPYGELQVAAAEEAERMAQLKDDVTMFHVQLELCNAYTFAGKGERAMVAFSYCLKKIDEQRPEFLSHLDTVLWKYKFVLGSIAEFPEMKLEQIERALLDYKRRLEEAGYSDRNYHYMRAQVHSELGRAQEAKSTLPEIMAMKRDGQSDCRACETNFESELNFDLQDWKGCLERGATILSGRARCASVPGRSLGFLSVALWREGKLEEAEHCLTWGLRITEGNAMYLAATAEYLESCARLEEFELGIRVLETRIAWALESYQARKKLILYARAALFLGAALKKNGEFRVRLPVLPNGCPGESASEVRDWLTGESMTLAKRFDERNGNGFFTEDVARILSGI